MSDLAIPEQLRLTIPARKAEARRLTQVEMVTVDSLELQAAQDHDAAAAKGQAARKMHRISSVRQKEGRGSTESRRRSTMMERKIVCDLNLVSVDFGREEELRPGNTFRISFRHTNGQPTGTIEVYQGEAEHFIVELEAVAAFIRAALVK